MRMKNIRDEVLILNRSIESIFNCVLKLYLKIIENRYEIPPTLRLTFLLNNSQSDNKNFKAHMCK